MTPNNATLIEGDGSDEGRDDWRVPRRHTHLQGMAEWVCSDLSPQVSPSVGLQGLLGGGGQGSRPLRPQLVAHLLPPLHWGSLPGKLDRAGSTGGTTDDTEARDCHSPWHTMR